MDGKPISKPRKPASKWHAVIVVVQTASCAAAALCRNTRYLSNEAPRLPLSKCSSPDQCPCTFRHFDDRRTGARRAADLGARGDHPKSEKRKIRGRRARDQT
jgi:hypothetical protein